MTRRPVPHRRRPPTAPGGWRYPVTAFFRVPTPVAGCAAVGPGPRWRSVTTCLRNTGPSSAPLIGCPGLEQVCPVPVPPFAAAGGEEPRSAPSNPPPGPAKRSDRRPVRTTPTSAPRHEGRASQMRGARSELPREHPLQEPPPASARIRLSGSVHVARMTATNPPRCRKLDKHRTTFRDRQRDGQSTPSGGPHRPSSSCPSQRLSYGDRVEVLATARGSRPLQEKPSNPNCLGAKQTTAGPTYPRRVGSTAKLSPM